MELKPATYQSEIDSLKVLIVPFMELKQIFCVGRLRMLNVLIVPFMELKLILYQNIIAVQRRS